MDPLWQRNDNDSNAVASRIANDRENSPRTVTLITLISDNVSPMVSRIAGINAVFAVF